MNDLWKQIYYNNERLDDIYKQKYLKTEPEYFKKNAIEFLVELGEFINETKCFKYWTIKKANIDNVLEEYADAITMCLYFFGDLKLDLDLNNLPKHIEEKNILDVFNYLYIKGSKLMTDEYSEKLVKDLFSNLLYVGKILNLKDEDIINAIHKKHIIIEERLNSDY